MKNPILIIRIIFCLLLIVILVGCMPFYPPIESGPNIQLIATIPSDRTYRSVSGEFIDYDGYLEDKKETDFVPIEFIPSDPRPYKVDFVDDAKYKRWVRYFGDADSETFEIYGNYTISDYTYGIEKDIGIKSYKDPFYDNDKIYTYIEFYAVFERGVPEPSRLNGDKAYLYMSYNDYTNPYVLTYEINVNNNVYRTTKFKIKHDYPASLGDDFVLNFKLKDGDGGDIVTFIYNNTVDDFVHFFATYDDKLLDAANMYINEEYDDWNGDDQIEIKPWTMFCATRSVHDAVAYGWGCADAVEHFNADMEDQRKALNASLAGGWSSTIAPANDWANGYVFGTQTNDNPLTYSYLLINSTVYYPFKPGFSTYIYVNNGESWEPNRDWKTTSYTAGIDCSGFVQRAAGYLGNYYNAWELINTRRVWDENRYKMSTDDFASILNSNSIDRDKLVPGDIIVRSDEHVAIILDIEFDEDEAREVERDKVILIEATKGKNNDWRVLNTRKWDDLLNYILYDPRRLK